MDLEVWKGYGILKGHFPGLGSLEFEGLGKEKSQIIIRSSVVSLTIMLGSLENLQSHKIWV